MGRIVKLPNCIQTSAECADHEQYKHAKSPIHMHMLKITTYIHVYIAQHEAGKFEVEAKIIRERYRCRHEGGGVVTTKT